MLDYPKLSIWSRKSRNFLFRFITVSFNSIKNCYSFKSLTYNQFSPLTNSPLIFPIHCISQKQISPHCSTACWFISTPEISSNDKINFLWAFKRPLVNAPMIKIIKIWLYTSFCSVFSILKKYFFNDLFCAPFISYLYFCCLLASHIKQNSV